MSESLICQEVLPMGTDWRVEVILQLKTLVKAQPLILGTYRLRRRSVCRLRLIVRRTIARNVGGIFEVRIILGRWQCVSQRGHLKGVEGNLSIRGRPILHGLGLVSCFS